MENSSKNYPIIIDISAKKSFFKVDRNDPNFDKPLSALTTHYQEPVKKIPAPVDYGEFEFIEPSNTNL